VTEPRRTLALVDGEHHPAVTRDAIEEARGRGYDVVGAVLVGGTEKLIAGTAPDLGVPVHAPGGTPPAALAAVLDDLRPEVVLDLSDEPILSPGLRMACAAEALARDVAYEAPGAHFWPPAREAPPPGLACLAVTGVGKRIGKRAVTGEAARRAAARDLRPVVVAMGRGGPATPEVADPVALTLATLRALVADGRHAASDHLETAFTTGVIAVGARRAGGGPAGEPFASTVGDALAVAASLAPGIVVLDGSGASTPPVRAHTELLVVPGAHPVRRFEETLDRVRLLRATAAVVTLGVGPVPGSEDHDPLFTYLRDALGPARVVTTRMEPEAIADVRGRDAFFLTTAHPDAAAAQAAALAASAGCRIVGWSARLADRAGLVDDLDGAPGYDVLLTELKAAAVDTAAARAEARGADVVVVANRLRNVDGDLGGLLDLVTDLARERAASHP
jgi:cyclic 2,3-diphosphoglycerate synthetase